MILVIRTIANSTQKLVAYIETLLPILQQETMIVVLLHLHSLLQDHASKILHFHDHIYIMKEVSDNCDHYLLFASVRHGIDLRSRFSCWISGGKMTYTIVAVLYVQ